MTIEICDLGDVMTETKHCSPDPAIFPDSWFGWGSKETFQGPWPQCP